jgi:hypothetical protein
MSTMSLFRTCTSITSVTWRCSRVRRSPSLARSTSSGLARSAGGTDSAPYYESFELDRPIKLFDDIGDMYRAYEALCELFSWPGTTVIPGYDPRVAELFRMIEPSCIYLTAPKNPAGNSKPQEDENSAEA